MSPSCGATAGSMAEAGSPSTRRPASRAAPKIRFVLAISGWPGRNATRTYTTGSPRARAAAMAAPARSTTASS
jgi:hypothetical protein